MEIKVSAVVPVYNSVNTLERAIRSLLIQPEINEIFIVDDGSSDGSYELAKSLEIIHSLLKVLTHENRINKGASAARNLGLTYCTNEWIQFLDADDELLDGKVTKNIIYLINKSSLIVGNSIYRNQYGEKKRHYWKNWKLGLLVTRLGVTSSNLWSKYWLVKVGGWNELISSSQEYDLILRLAKVNPIFSFCPYFCSVIHEVPSSITRLGSLNSERIKNSMEFRYQVKKFLIEKKSYSFMHKMFFNGIIGNISKKNNVPAEYSLLFYYIFKSYKFLSDRFVNNKYSIN
ncbi:glycosyltransferase family 2 protein [Algoriphagus sp.]|uniref:glycosyltransferase family 2 protein n=1 Tax=Algoriphagus sp. TaxID=1872435 RepID=UPI002623E745|nr:glycosyltransferase family 2 protein [Algoriphagus sp.]